MKVTLSKKKKSLLHNIKRYEICNSLFTKFTDTVKDIFVPSWLSDFMKNNPTENSQNTVIDEEDQNGNEIKDSDDNNYSSPHENPVVGDRRPAQPRPLHPEYTNYHQQVKAVSRRSAMTGYAADHMPSNHEMQYPPGPRYSTSNHDGSLPHAGQISETMPRLGDKQNCLSLTGADIEQLKNRLHPSADAQLSSDMNYQSTTASIDNDDDGNGSISVDPEDSCDCESSKVWSNISYIKKNESDSFRTKPRFEPSLLVSPFLKDSLLSDSQHESSFYGGKTQYGGASSRRKMRLKESNPYSAATPYRRQVNAKPLHKNSTGAVTSSTAKRISDILEMMATPISDARKIPMNNHNLADTVLQFSPSNFKRRNRPSVAVSTFSNDSEKLPPRGPPTVMLNSPSKATIAKNRQSAYSAFKSSPTMENTQKQTEHINKVSSYTGKDTSKELARVFATTPQTASVEKTTTTVAATATASIPTASSATASSFFSIPLVTQPTATNVSEPSLSLGRPPISGKMKREKSYSTRGNSMKDMEDETEEPVQLKTDFVLPVTNVPKFSFGISTSSFSNQSGRSTFTPLTTTISADKSNSGTAQSTATTSTITATPSFGASTSFGSNTSFNSSESDFKFSTPIQTTLPDTNLVSEGLPSVSDFKFSSPDKVIVDSAKHTFQFSVSSTLPKPKSTSIFDEKPAFTLKTSGSKPVDSSSGSSSSSGGFGGIQPASTLKTGSVMDVLGGQKKETSKAQVDPLMAKFLTVDSWDCDACMVPNKTESKKCVSCGTRKPSAASTKAPTTTSSVVTDSLMAKFISSPDSWDCEICMLLNKPEATKCVACGASKPSATQPKASVSLQPDSLMAKFMPSSGSWECDTCMIQNKAEATKCVACETPKPGCKPTLFTTTPATTVAPTSSDKVDPLMAKFLKSDTWECSVCMLQNKESDSVCVACQTANPNAPPAPPPNAASHMVHCLSQTEKQSVGTSNCQLDKALSMWKCDTCLVSNPLHCRKCIACDTPHIKPAVIATIAANSSGSVDVLPKFGVITSTGFKFSAASSSSDSAPISSAFKFGTSSTSDAAPISTGFKFGSETAPISSSFKLDPNVSSAPSNGFKFGVPSSQEDSTKSESGVGNSSGFKFGFVSPVPGNKPGSDFKFGNSDDKKEKSDDQPKPASFVFSQPKSDGFPFSMKETTAPLTSLADPSTSNSGNSSSLNCTTASAALPITAPTSTFATAVSSSPSSSSGFCFTGTDKPVAAGFKIPAPDTKTTSSAALPTFSVSTEKSATPIFGTAGSSDSTKNVASTFIFGSDSSKNTNAPSTGGPKSSFSLTSPLKRERDDEADGPSGAKRSVTSASGNATPAADFNFSAAAQPNAIFSGGFTSFSDSANKNPFSATTTNSSTVSNNQQFQFGNSLPAFGVISSNSSSGSGANSGSSSTTAPSTFTSPGFNFPLVQTTASAPTVTTTTQSTPAFVFGSPASAASSPATFGASAPTFQFRPANPTPPLFNSKPFNAATTTPATTNFTSNRSSEPFSFPNTGGVFQFTGKQSSDNTTTAATTAVNSNLFQFGQTPSTNTNPGPLGTGTSPGFQFNSTPNFNFTSGNFTFSGNSDSSQPQSGRVVKKAIRRTRKV
ncbi:nuclear pore complex protein Nup153 isoform X2 [Octopus bimaculoides]|uniref:nuclear pore complex protein Nup153 isoform X2 n=1 Tax=Octopus bimaculoides TaxID=37653 RepID=UPI00071C8290|nr:nuclear pore complex protein Nup153 isoform X2 [Octopus bimaculoides]|eukprot:XP_014787467.1 PREDICTED: nuclear pore complex protein Nup153-like isoform X2 [Octopus bimaculoides]